MSHDSIRGLRMTEFFGKANSYYYNWLRVPRVAALNEQLVQLIFLEFSGGKLVQKQFFLAFFPIVSTPQIMVCKLRCDVLIFQIYTMDTAN